MILQLPEEILFLISKQLENQHDRLHLATSCRKLYSVLHSTIFCMVKLCGCCSADVEIKQVSQIFYTIFRNPKLARMVQVLELSPWNTATTCGHHGYPSMVDFDADIMERLVLEVTSDSHRQKTWISDLRRGVTDAWLALLIPRLSNLRKISLIWSIGADYVSTMFVEVATSKTPTFPHLEEAWAAHWDTEGGADTKLMLPFFRFPAMRKLGGLMLCDEDEIQELPSRNIDIGRSHVTHIDLSMSNATDGLQDWIRSCKALKTFRISDGGAIVSHMPTNPRRLYEALLLHKISLQAISISYSPRDIDPDESFMGPFADFTNLKILHIPYTGILELEDEGVPTQKLTDILPSSLELLYLFTPDAAMLEGVLEQCKLLLESNVCLNLRTICVESSDFSDPEIGRKVEDLKRQCEDRSVSMRTFDLGSRKVIEYWDSEWPCDHVFDK